MHAGCKPACTFILEIAIVWEISVCLPLMLLITTHMKSVDINQLNSYTSTTIFSLFIWLYYAIYTMDWNGLSNQACHEHLLKETKVMLN